MRLFRLLPAILLALLLAAVPASAAPRKERCGGKRQQPCHRSTTASARTEIDGFLKTLESASVRKRLKLPSVAKQLGRKGAKAMAAGRRRAAGFAPNTRTGLGTTKGRPCPKGKRLNAQNLCAKPPKKKGRARSAALPPSIPVGQGRSPLQLGDLKIEDGGFSAPVGQGKSGEKVVIADEVTRKNGSYASRDISLETPVQRCPSESGFVQGAGTYSAVFEVGRMVEGKLFVTRVTLKTEMRWRSLNGEDGQLGPVVSDGALKLMTGELEYFTKNERTGRESTHETQFANVRWDVTDWYMTGTHPSVYGEPGNYAGARGEVQSLAGELVDVIWAQAKRSFARAQTFWQTPNACVRIALDPDAGVLKPGQSTKVDATVRFTDLAVTIAPRGKYTATASAGAGVTPATGPSNLKPHPFTFRAPGAKWAATNRPSMTVKLASRAGAAAETLAFASDDFPVRYRILGGSWRQNSSGEGTSILCGRQSGTRDFMSTGPVADDDEANELTLGYGGSVSGDMVGRAPARYANQRTVSCKHDDQGHKVPCDVFMPNTSKNAFAGFSVRAPSANGTATLSWIVEDPEVGYVDTGEDTCNTHLWGALPTAATQTTVPMSTLLAPGPHTFTLKGTKVVPDRAGQGSLTTTYEATLTLERIP